MAEIIDEPIRKGRRAGVRRVKKHTLKTDMTPMVDLGFLLIAFFVITTEMIKPAALKLSMPHDGAGTQVANSNALTVLLDSNSIYYYHGEWANAKEKNQVFKTSIAFNNGLGDVIRQKQAWLDEINIPGGEGRKGLMMMIKSSKRADYGSMIAILDEILINNVQKYALVSLDKEEKEFLDRKNF